MAISKDSLEQRLDKVALDEEQHDLEFQQPVEEQTEAQAFASELAEASGDLPPHVEPEGVQVAGLKDVVESVARRLIPDEKRIVEAEKKVLPPLADKPIQEVEGQLVVREATTEEVADLMEAVGGEYTKGLNVVRIGDNLDAYDVGQHLAKVKDANSTLFEAQRRGTLNIEALTKLAEKSGTDNIVAHWLARSPGDGEVAEKVLAGLIAARQVTDETVEQLTKARAMNPGSERDEAFSKFYRLMTIESNIYANLSGAISEAGRTLYMTSKIPDIDLTGRATELQKLFGADSVEDFEFIGEKYSQLKTRAQRSKFVQQGILSKSMDVVTEVWINSILSAPTTHMVNIAGNATYQGLHMLETVAAAGIGRVRSMATGSKDRAHLRDAIVHLDAVRESVRDALVVSSKAMLKEEASDLGSKIDVRNRRAIGTTGDPRDVIQMYRDGNMAGMAVNALGIYARIPGRFLVAEDEFFKAIGYRVAIRKQAAYAGYDAYDAAIAAGKTPDEAAHLSAMEEARLMANPPVSFVDNAKAAAKEMTFQSDLTGAMGNLQGAFSHPIMKLFVPFFKTPTNVITAVMKRSPAAALFPSVRNAIQAGGREADEALARIAVGSTIGATFAGIAMGVDDPDKDTLIMGAGPMDYKARQGMQRLGIQPYSINFKQEDGTYKSVTFSRLDPISGVLAMAADFAYYSQYEDDEATLGNLAMAMTLGIAQYAEELPFLDGVKDISSVLTNPDIEGRAVAFAELFAKKGFDAGMSFIPGNSSFFAGIERMNDPEMGSKLLPEEGLFGEDPTTLPAPLRAFYTSLQTAKERNPFFNAEIEPRLNLYGEVMKAGTGAGWEFVSPIRVKNTKYNIVDRELMELGLGIPMPRKKIDGVLLNATQYNQIIKYMNIDRAERVPGDDDYDAADGMLGDLTKIVLSSEYKSLPTKEDKRNQLNKIVSERRKDAIKRLRAEDSYLNTKILDVQ
jgi:hypothetical protein